MDTDQCVILFNLSFHGNVVTLNSVQPYVSNENQPTIISFRNEKNVLTYS